jgi:hypothetical protein
MINQISAGTMINPRSTTGTATAAMTIAASVSIISSISITSICLKPTGLQLDSAELHSRLGEPASHSHVICRRPRLGCPAGDKG